MLELMGDAVLECFIMCNCFVNILFKFTPTNLYKIKMVLLSNSFLSKVAIGYNINWFLPDKDHTIE
jgi:dsRNA-specific ribonuclease